MTPARYRHRPLEVEAMQYTADNALAICRWAKPDYDPAGAYDLDEAPIVIGDGGALSVAVPGDERPGLDEAAAAVGDWITRDAAGTYAVLTHHEFQKQYEVAP